MDLFYPPELPITIYRQEISELLQDNQVIIIAGDTGSGKTTQIPKICLDAFPDMKGIIGCTQPRRVAATSVSEQVRRELGDQGELVGCKIRFRDHTTSKTRIKFMTDGVLLAETRHDPLLKKYAVLIIDEAHERSLNIDFLLGYIRQLISSRKELKIIVTSATIDTELFSKHFKNAPVLQIEGRTYPVDLIYNPPEDEDNDTSFVDHCIDTVSDICDHYPPGDILVFLPTEKDIRACSDILIGRQPNRLILPMFGRLQSSDQQKIFKQYNKYKIIISTNVAETSVTVPGITYVVDTGLARISSYNPRSRTTSLPVARVSQASCNQRSGRCGRVGPGTCIRLYSEEDFLSRTPFTIPEIQRSNLAEVILQMVSLNLGNPFDFPFLDAPSKNAIRDGYRILEELEAISSTKQLTSHGRLMAQLPIDPVISRIIIEAAANNCLSDIIIIASALAIQDPRIRPTEKEQRADEAHKSFAHPHSDFIVLLNIWNTFHKNNKEFSWSDLKRFCKKYYLSFQRMREWIDLHEQLHRILKKRAGFSFEITEPTYEQLHKSLLSGFFRQCARRKKGSTYQTGSNQEIMIFPGSHQFLKSGDLILAGFLMETTRLYAMTVATIEPEWVEDAAKTFCSYSWSNIRWQKKTGRVIADESVSLKGLPLMSGRVVNFGKRDKKNRQEARSVFIQKGLVEGNIDSNFSFLIKNFALIKHWQETEHKLRKKDVVMEDAAIFEFYNKNIPTDVYDRYTLIQHIKKQGEKTFFMDEQDILLRIPDDKELADYPTELTYNTISLKLSYCFEPGDSKDGVTAHIPSHLLDNLKPELFEWLVPALLREKTIFLLKGLPKKIRKHLIPVNQTADRALDSFVLYRGNYHRELAAAIFRMFKISIHNSDWPSPLPEHLQMRFSIEDSDENLLISGRQLGKLKDGLNSNPEKNIKSYLHPKEDQLIKKISDQLYSSWDFAQIPPLLPLYTKNDHVAGHLFAALKSYPDRQAVQVVYLKSKCEAEKLNTTGTHYLFRLVFKDQFKLLKKHCRIILTGPSVQWLATYHDGNGKTIDAVITCILRLVFGTNFSPIIQKQQFEKIITQVKQTGLFKTGKIIIDQITALLRQRKVAFETINKYELLSQKSGGKHTALYDELRDQLNIILPVDFLENFSENIFSETPRYLKSLSIRIERAYSNPHKDIQKNKLIKCHGDNIISFRDKIPDTGDECKELYSEYCYLVAEMRVSLFSPELKTKTAVSDKKLSQLWKQISSIC